MSGMYRMTIVRQGLLVLMMCLAGCAGLWQGLRPVEEARSRQILEALRQKEEAISTLRGLFQASISGSGLPLSQNFQGMFTYLQPDELYLKGFIRLGIPVMDFHRAGNHYELYFPAEGKIVTGRMDDTRERTQWDSLVMLSIRALDAVLGKISGSSQGEIRVWQGAERYRIDFIPRPSASAQEEFTVRTWVDKQNLEVRGIEYRRAFDDIVVLVECDDYREVKVNFSGGISSVQLPFVVRATDYRSGGGSVALDFQEYIVNAGKTASVGNLNNPK